MKPTTRAIALGLFLAFAPTNVALGACGIGSNIWAGRQGTGWRIIASITDIMTFKAISTTFGLAGCTEKDNLLRRFASENFDHLAVEMARGRGEHLDTFAHLLRVREEDRPYFRGFAQRNVPTLLSHDRVTVDEMLGALDRLMAEDERLAAYVGS